MKNLIKISPIALGCLVFASAELALTTTAQAVPVEITQNDNGTVAVVVAEGKTLTYTLNGETVSVAGGESIQIPADATNVFFPAGSTVTVKRAAVAKPFTFKVVRDVTLGAINKPTLKQHSTAFVPSYAPGVRQDGGPSIESAFVNPTTIGGQPGTDKK